MALVALFGFFALRELPIQLFPDIDQPRISIWTGWRAASPLEVEAELLEPQERVLQGLPGLESMQANANSGGSYVELQFGLETNMDQMLVEVISRLNRLPPLPADADPPAISLAGGAQGGPALTWFFVQLLPDTPGTLEEYEPRIREILETRLSAIDGVASVNINAGREEQLQVTVDPYRAAELGIMLPDIASRAAAANDVSGGQVDIGRREFTLRFTGRYQPEQLSQLVLDWRDGRPVRLGDVASVKVDRSRRAGLAYQNNNPAMGIRINRSNGANVLETLDEVKREVAAIRDGPFREMGLGIEQSFDASVFIRRAISLLTNNLLLGVVLAVGVLWWFLRDYRATALIATAIPASLLATFIVLQLTGRSLNVISLAGLAFAVGMVLDAAIVVAENIVRLRERGQLPDQAAEQGSRQVQSALMASTATTVAIFLPVLFLRDVEGQLFADLALTIAIAVSLSLLVALTVLPSAAGRWLRARSLGDAHNQRWRRLAAGLMRLSAGRRRQLGWIGGLIAAAVLLTVLWFPQLDYLPPVKRDAVDVFLDLPPGANVDYIDHEIVKPIIERLRPFMDGERQPALKNYYVLVWPGGGTIGARVLDQSRVGELEALMRDEILVGFPDLRAFAAQGDLFGDFSGGRNISLHLQAADSQALYDAAREGERLLAEAFPGANVRTQPNIEMAEPELRLQPHDQRINEAGWGRADVAGLVRTLGQGRWLGEHFDGDKRMDIIMRADGWGTPEELAGVPVVTPSGAVMPLGELVSVTQTTGPAQMRRVDGRRTVTLVLAPPDHLSLESALRVIREQVEPALREALPASGTIVYGGSADGLSRAISAMGSNFGIALLILLLLMAGLFRSLKDSLLVVMTIPLATVGGIIALRVLNLVAFQPMDLLTMIGFIILLGLVVNNAILLVSQTRMAEADGLSRDEAVEQALYVRLRPIFMSTTTSIVGMLPLLLLPGAGSIIYRGLAAVIVGGMSVSLLFTLILLPCLLRLGQSVAPVTTTQTPATVGLESAA
ncbi:MAG: efflux RND transporter permease subunit [Wenzhouxiangellaceae bacterium]